MKLLINTQSIRYPMTGIGNYTANLLAEYSKDPLFESIQCYDGNCWVNVSDQILLESKSHKAYFNDKPLADAGQKVRSLIRSIPGAYPIKSWINNHRFRNVNTKGAVYHEPNIILKPLSVPSVVTIHDLSFFKYPGFHPKERIRWMMGNIHKTLHQADQVIVDSDVVRQDLLEFCPIDEGKLKTIHLGVDSQLFRHVEQPRLVQDLARYRLSNQKYVLFVGTIEPRKGLSLLLDAWISMSAQDKGDYIVVVAGSQGWHNADIMQKIQLLSSQNSLKYLSYVPAKDLASLYSGAVCFVYPSFYEGFGLPVLEAMSCGSPVLVAKGTAMEEFIGEAGLVFDNGSHESLGYQLTHLLTNSMLRHKMSLSGMRLARNLSWKRCADITASTYKKVLS